MHVFFLQCLFFKCVFCILGFFYKILFYLYVVCFVLLSFCFMSSV
jgi:hypothetical protein